MKCVRAFSSSCLQVILVYLHPFRHNSLLCSQKLQKKSLNTYFWSWRSFKVIDVDILRSSSPLLSSISVPIWNHFHVRQANSRKINNFLEGYPSLTPACASLLEPRGSGLGQLKSTFNAENFMCRLFRFISSHFGTIQSWNVCHSPKSRNPLFWGFMVIQGHRRWHS